MVLLVHGRRVAADTLLSHPALVEASQQFLSQPATLPVGKLIYAAQGEEATVSAEEEAILCSSDATTCLIAVLVGSVAVAPGTAAGAAAAGPIARVAHHDEVTTSSLAALQQTVAGLGSAPARLWLAGAYADTRGTGAAVASALLRFLHTCEAALEVQLCCLVQHNTAPDGSPRSTALAVDLRSLSAYPAAPAPDCRGPLLPARMAQFAYGGSPLRGVYCAATRQLRLSLRQGRPPSHYFLLEAAALLNLDDEELLQRWSTSPQHEPPYFVAGDGGAGGREPVWGREPVAAPCQRVQPSFGGPYLPSLPFCPYPCSADMRASLRWLLEQSGPVVPTTQTFTWAEDGWRPAAKAGSAAAAAAAGDVQARLALV